jgi:hypothetical protein
MSLYQIVDFKGLAVAMLIILASIERLWGLITKNLSKRPALRRSIVLRAVMRRKAGLLLLRRAAANASASVKRAIPG